MASTEVLLVVFYLLQTYISCATLPEETMNTTALVNYFGYPCETHEVLTSDGYYLTLFRIPHGKTNVTRKPKPVLLLHGLLDSSDTWVINYPHQSLAFLLADKGFDVWLGNNRGNTYASKHKTLAVDSKQFWEFSFHEFAVYDVPALVDYVTMHTKSPQLHYVGHSEGNMIGFISFSENQTVADKVDTFVALAPVTRIKYIRGALKLMAPISTPITYLMKLIGEKSFLPQNEFIKWFANKICSTQKSAKFCASFLFLVTGFDFQSFNYTRLPVYFTHTPAGTSVKNILHFTQLASSERFQQFDYGWIENLLKYHQISPPEYNIQNMKNKVALFYSLKDWLSTPKDIATYLKPKLSNVIYEKIIPAYNHMDFVWGTDAYKILYPHVIDVLSAK